MLPSEYTPTGDEQGKFSPADILFKYLAFLPLFILSLAISVGLGIAYLRYTTPLYESSVQMLVKSGERNPVYGGGQGDVVERALYGPRDINMSNEIQKLRNIDVVARAVEKNDFHIQYFIEGSIKTSNIFKSLPYVLVPVAIMDSSQTYRVRFTDINPTGYTLLLDEEKRLRLGWDDEFNIKNCRFKLQSKLPIENLSEEDAVFIATWGNPRARAAEIMTQTAIFVADPNTTILSFSLRNDNVAMGKAILDALVKEYILNSVETKNIASFGTLSFIEIRLDSLNKELREIEQGLQDYRDENEVLSIDLQTQRYADLFTVAQDRVVDLEWELEILGYFEAYARSPRPRTDLVPSALGLRDDIIPVTVTAYNELRLQRENDARDLAPNSLQLKQLDKQIEDLQKTLFERIREHRSGIERMKNDLTQKLDGYKEYLKGVPEKQRRLFEIERQQKVKENLYLYLLQRKEEIAITTASTDPAYEALNPAAGRAEPVEPDAGKIRLFSILFGLLAPIGIIYIKDLLNDKLYTRDDIIKRTKAPIVGEIGHVEDNRNLVVAHESRNIISEQFRIVRSNLGFFMANQPWQTILVTSTVSGEGKSFISVNLAAVLALSGKKVALLEFDLRRPRIMRNLGFEKPTKGIANILLGHGTIDEVLHPMPGFDNLHIFPSGIVAPNPGELVLGDNNRIFFEEMKKRYDYIIIDSAPVGLVSDTFSLAPFVDTTLFIVRHRYTFKRQLEFIDEVFQQRKLPRLWIVVNDLKMGARFGYYGYGYGKGYGYGYGYGYVSQQKRSYQSSGVDDYYDVQPTWWKKTVSKWKGDA
jgi:capsular exopolysaccharide synthesis family protein